MFLRNTVVMARWRSALPTFLRRAVQVDQMEMDSAISQMYALCTTPSLVSKMSRARMMTKGHYFRDDPAFLVLQLGFIVVATIAYGWALGTAGAIVSALFVNVFLFLIGAVAFACVGRAVAVMLLFGSTRNSGRDGAAGGVPSSVREFSNDYLRSDVEWRYALDVHCNGYLTFFMWTQVVQYFFLFDAMNRTWLANMFYLVGCITYLYNIFLGYLEIPSLSHQQRLLYPVLVAGGLYVFFWLLDFNITSSMLKINWTPT